MKATIMTLIACMCSNLGVLYTLTSVLSTIATGGQIVETAIVTNDIKSAAVNTITTSSSVPLTVVSIPSPSTKVAPLPPRPNASVVVTVSSAIGMEIMLTSSVNAIVTPVVANKTASLIKGISVLEGNDLIIHLLQCDNVGAHVQCSL